jgi:hypothetical protein
MVFRILSNASSNDTMLAHLPQLAVSNIRDLDNRKQKAERFQELSLGE